MESSARISADAEARSILVVDDVPFCREMVAEALHARGFTTYRATNGVEALAILQQHPVDLVILDIAMPEMNGIEFMRAVRSDAKLAAIPIMLLTGGAEKELIQTARRLGAAEYLLKARFSLDDLIRRVNRCFETQKAEAAEREHLADQLAPLPAPVKLNPPPADLPKRIERDPLVAKIAECVKGARMFGGVISELVELTTLSGDHCAELTDAIRCDPMLAARVLAAVNGAETSKQRVAAIADAVRAIELPNLRQIIDLAATYPSFPPDAADGLDLLRLLQHSLAVASITDQIMPRSFESAPGAAYLAGLLHDIGEIVLRQALPDFFNEAVAAAAKANCALRAVIPHIFGMTVGEITAQVLGDVKLPTQIFAAIRENAEAEDNLYLSPPRAGVSTLAFALRLANLFANALQLCPCPRDGMIAPIGARLFRSTGLAPVSFDGQEIRANLLMKTSQWIGDPSYQPPVAHYPAPAVRPKIAYIRQSTFAPVDPLAEALSVFAELITFERPPTRPDEMKDVAAMVVAAPQLGSVPLSALERCRQLAAQESVALRVAHFVERIVPNTDPPPDWVQLIELPVSLENLARTAGAILPVE